MTATHTRNLALKQLLEERRRTLQDDVRSRLRDGRGGQQNDGRDQIEVSDDDIQGELSFALLQMRAETLVRIEEAFVRLELGTYGSCLACGRDIPEKRLKALPFAVRCQKCEESRETAQGSLRTRGQQRAGFSLFPDIVTP